MGATGLEMTPLGAESRAGPPFASPLSIRPAARKTVTHRNWTQARKAVLAALLEIPCVVVIVGAPGTGKTLLLADIARALKDAGAAPVLYERGDLAAGSDAMSAAGPAITRIVMIDEADRTSDTALAHLATQPGLGLVLARTDDPTGDPRFAAAVGERRYTVVRLEPLARDEIPAFLDASLARAGRPGGLIRTDAVARIALHSGGVPRLVNMLASAALFLAASETSDQVDAEHVDAAADMSGLLDHADGEALPSWDAEPPEDVPEIAPADLLAIAQSWADPANVARHPERAVTAAAVARRAEQAPAPTTLDQPLLRASGHSRIGLPVAPRAGGARHRAAAAAVLLLAGAGTAGWLALVYPAPAPRVEAGASPQAAAPSRQPQVAVASPAATQSAAGRAMPSALAIPASEGTLTESKGASTSTDPRVDPGASSHVAVARQDSSTPPSSQEPAAAHPGSSAAALAPLHGPPAPAGARAGAPAGANPRPAPTTQAQAGRPARAHTRTESHPELDKHVDVLIGALRALSAHERPPAPGDPGSGVLETDGTGEVPRGPRSDAASAGYLGSYVMGPDGRRMFVQDP